MTISPMTDAQLAEKIIALVKSARTRFGIAENMSGTDACEAVGLGLTFDGIAGGALGLLDETHSLIVVNPSITNSGRREFTIFHEIVHYLLNQDGELFEYFTEVLRNDERAFDAAFERCCDMGAAEFLLPREQVRAAIDQHGFSVDLVNVLHPATNASIATIASQLALNAPLDCYIVVCFFDVSPRWPHSRGLYVEVAVRTSGAFPIARGTMIPPDHLFYRVWTNGQPLEGDGYIPFASGKKFPCTHVEARRIGNQVVGILYCDHPRRKGQLSMELSF